MRALYAVQKRIWRIARPRTRGVKVMPFSSSGEILLIRNSYGRADLFVLPGGGIRPFEGPEKAARREVREELGCDLTELTFVSTHFSSAEGKRDTIFFFRATILGEPRPDRWELAEAKFFSLADLPQNLSAASRRRVDEHVGASVADGSW